MKGSQNLTKMFRKIKKNEKIILESTITLVIIITVSIIFSPPGRPRTISSLLTFYFNGEENNGLQAQILIENSTTFELEVNTELVSVIESDLIFLSGQIEGLQRINIYNFTYDPLPGAVNVYLDNVRYMQRNFLDEIITITNSDKNKWWYISEWMFTPILKEGETKKDAYPPFGPGDYDFFEFYSCEPAFHIYNENVTILQNVTVIASMWIIEDGNWTFNEEFYQVLVEEVLSLKERIFGINNISLPWLDKDGTYINKYYSTDYNLSESIPGELGIILCYIYLGIEYDDSINRTERNSILKVLEVLLTSKWFFSDGLWLSPSDFSDIDFIKIVVGGTLLVFVLPAPLILTIIHGLRILRSKRKKKYQKPNK